MGRARGQRDLRKIGRDKPTFEKFTELPLIFHPYRAATRYGKLIFDFQAFSWPVILGINIELAGNPLNALDLLDGAPDVLFQSFRGNLAAQAYDASFDQDGHISKSDSKNFS